jgi:ANTAR domain
LTAACGFGRQAEPTSASRYVNTGELTGQFLFDAFPDNPNDPQADGTSNLAASLETSMRSGHTDNMRIQRYDIRDPADPEKFLPKVWSPSNSPLLDHDELMGVVHCVEEISDSSQLLAEMERAVAEGDPWTCNELLHTFAAISTVENTRHFERQQALVAETEQLWRAIETRDTIGQAKGMLMERFDIDAAGRRRPIAGLLDRLLKPLLLATVSRLNSATAVWKISKPLSTARYSDASGPPKSRRMAASAVGCACAVF